MASALEEACQIYFNICKNHTHTIDIHTLNRSIDKIENIIRLISNSKLNLSECVEINNISRKLILFFLSNAEFFLKVAENESNKELKSLFVLLGNNDIHFAHLLELKFGTINVSV